jgi:hypothetical protein
MQFAFWNSKLHRKDDFGKGTAITVKDFSNLDTLPCFKENSEGSIGEH